MYSGSQGACQLRIPKMRRNSMLIWLGPERSAPRLQPVPPRLELSDGCSGLLQRFRHDLHAPPHPRVILVLSALALGPLVLGEKDLAWGWLRLSQDGFWIGLWMALRALCLTVAFSVALSALSVSEMVRLFETVGLKGLGFALGVALNLLPTLQENAMAARKAKKLKPYSPPKPGVNGGKKKRDVTVMCVFVLMVKRAT